MAGTTAITLCAGGGGDAAGSVKSNCKKMREIAGKLRCRNETYRSLKEHHFCTGVTRGTNKHAQGTTKGNCRKIAEIPESCENLRALTPAPLLFVNSDAAPMLGRR